MESRVRLEVALSQLEFARLYTHSLIDDLDDDQWLWMPSGCSTHVAWQIGHLAMAEYGLCLFRVRGRQPADRALMDSEFRKKFSRGSQPDPAAAGNPSPAELRSTLAKVHQQALQELSALADADLTDAIDEPYAVEPTKLGALYFCSAHEMLHAGQIGLLRRSMGLSPVR